MNGRAFYPLIMLIGLSIAYWALRQRWHRSQLDDSQKAAVGLAAFIGAMLGAKIPFVLSSTAGQVGWFWMTDGKTILGGIFGGYLSVEIAKRLVGIRTHTGDNFAVPVAIAIAAGRLGCFFSGCCFGKPTNLPWAVAFPTAGDLVPRHPTQLYEVAFHLSALAVLLLCEWRGWLRHRRLALYLLGYLAFRFLTEFIRPEPKFWLGLTAYQLATVVLAILLVAVFPRKLADNEPVQPPLDEEQKPDASRPAAD